MKTENASILLELSNRAYILLLFSCVSLVLGFNLGSVILWIPAACILFYFGSLIKNDFSFDNLTIHAELPRNSTRLGEFLTLQLLFTNKKTTEITLYYQVKLPNECQIILGYAENQCRILPNSEYSVKITFICLKRGNYSLSPVILRLTDPFHIIFKELKINISPTSLIRVIPARPRIPIPTDRKRQIWDRLTGKFAYRRKGLGDEFFGLRDYQRDDIRFISWRASARRGKLIVKEFEDELILRVIVAIDISHRMRGDKLEFALTSLLEIAELMEKTQDALGCVLFSDRIFRTQKTARHGNQFNRIVRLVHDITAQPTESNLKSVVPVIQGLKGSKGIVIVFSDVEGVLKEKMDAIGELGKFGHHIIYCDIHTPNFGLLHTDGYPFDPFIQEQELIQEQIIAPVIHQKYLTRKQSIQDILQKIGADYLFIDNYHTNILLLLEKLLFPTPNITN
jgi:uncharacterized protein (DUF58 family)